MKLLYFRVWNIIYTDPGILQGFTIKQLTFCIFAFNRIRRVRIPLWIMGYNKKQAIEINEIRKKIIEEESKDEHI